LVYVPFWDGYAILPQNSTATKTDKGVMCNKGKGVNNISLVVAGILSCIASALHIGVIIGGPVWYRFFGAGEHMATLAMQGSYTPAVITSVIASVLLACGLYAFSGAGIIRRLPYVRFCLVAITAVYLVRGIGGIVVAFIPSLQDVEQLSFTFMIWSSLICVVYAVAYLVGTFKGWVGLSPSHTKIGP
jgi:hypothetical protein